MNGPLFSVIIPACNVAPYIGEAIASLQRQNFFAFNVFIVIEESTDETFRIARDMTAEDPRFHLISLPRSGSASVSRNWGIEHADGDYLIFLDGDDWLETDALETLASDLRDSGPVDLLMEAATIYYQEPDGTLRKGRIISDKPADGKIYRGVDLLAREILPQKLDQATWMRTYSRTFLKREKLFQIPGRRHQDTEWIPRVFCAAERIAIGDHPYYCYRKRPDSVTTSVIQKSVYDEAANTASLFDFFLKSNFPEPLRGRIATFFTDLLNSFFATFKRKVYTRENRKKAFRQLLGGRDGLIRYLKIVRYARPGKQLMIPFVLLARLPGCFTLAEWGFRFLYYPLIYRIWGKRKEQR